MNKKGFTLIELLVTIVLVISILGIAVVSVMRLSERQKENEYNKVKEQVMTAAHQYFTSNEYLFEGVEESGYGIITVEELVEKDYLNKVTNPLTGKPLNVCDQIKVTKDRNGKFKLSYFEINEYSSTVCSSNSLMIKTHEKAPEITVSFNAEKGDDFWFNKKELNDQEKELGNEMNGLFVKIETNSTNIKYCESASGANVCSGELRNLVSYSEWNFDGKSGYYDKETFNKEEEHKKVCYVAINESGNTTACIEAGVDISVPSILVSTDVDSDNTAWYSLDSVNYSGTIKDDISGIKTMEYFWNQSGLSTAEASSDSKEWNGSLYPDGKSLSVSIIEGTTNEVTKSNKFEAQGHRKIRYVACDVAGNCGSSGKDIKIDRTPPSVIIATDVDSDNNKWYNYEEVGYSATATDNYAGLSSMNSYWNEQVLTTASAESQMYSWNGNSYPEGGTQTISVTSGSATKTHSNSFSAQGHRKIRYVVCDIAGNCTTTKEKNIKIDRTAPEVVVTTDVDDDNSVWYKLDSVIYSATATDNYAGLSSMKSYWNKYGLTTANADSNTYSWNGSSYPNGGSETVSVTSGTVTKTHSNNLSAQGHRKIRYKACDTAGNCASDVKVVKIDRTAPSVVVTTDVDSNNNAWYSRNSVSYTANSTDEYSGLITVKSYWNKAGLTTANADSNTYSWNGSSYPNGGSETVSVTSGSLSKTHSNTFSAEGHRKIRYVACDVVGNCSSDVKVVKIDRTPPIFVRYSGGRTNCGPNYWGYSIEFRDELTSSIAYMPEYYSSWDCGGEKTGGFYWAANDDAYKRNSSTSNSIYSVFAGCSNNPSPAAKFYLIDEAGNKSNTLTVTANKSSTAYSPSIDSCDWSKWWNVQ